MTMVMCKLPSFHGLPNENWHAEATPQNTVFWKWKEQFQMKAKLLQLKWGILSQPTNIGSGKNKNSLFFLLGLKINLRTCFESNNFSSNSWAFRYSVFQRVLFCLADSKFSTKPKWCGRGVQNYPLVRRMSVISHMNILWYKNSWLFP